LKKLFSLDRWLRILKKEDIKKILDSLKIKYYIKNNCDEGVKNNKKN
jgi:hypothetical protein